jgi:Flp pilus assembly protein TadG
MPTRRSTEGTAAGGAGFLRRVRRLLRGERGSQIMEVALVAPLFFMLMFGITEFGRAIWLFGSISHAAREGTRYAIVRGGESGRAATEDEIQTFVRNVIGLSDAQVTTTWDPDNMPGSVVEVTVQLPFDPIFPVMPSVPLSSTSRLVISF